MTQRDYFDRALKQKDLTDEAKEALARIEKEFIDRYYEWLDDIDNMNDHDFGWKYGFCKRKDIVVKDNIAGVTRFQKYGWQGRWMPDWEKAGFDKYVLWELVKKGSLSCKEYFNSYAVAIRHNEWVFISQEKAKAIYRAHKAAEKGDKQ